MSIISFKQVHYTYPGDELESLCGVDLEIEEGSFVAVLGHNGSGKSTLAKHMNAILVPDSGSVIVDGIENFAGVLRFKACPEQVVYEGQEGIPVFFALHDMMEGVVFILHKVVDYFRRPVFRLAVQTVGEDLVHIVQKEAVSSVRIRIFRICLPQVAPHGHIVEGPVGIVEERLKRKIEQVIVHIHGLFQSFLVLRHRQIGLKKRKDLCRLIGFVIAGVVSFNGIRCFQPEQTAHILLCNTRCDITGCIELPVEVSDPQPGFRKPGKTAAIRKYLRVLAAGAANPVVRYAVGTEAKLPESIRLSFRRGIRQFLNITGPAVGAALKHIQLKAVARTSSPC